MTSDTTGVRDSVVNQLLAKINGVKEVSFFVERATEPLRYQKLTSLLGQQYTCSGANKST